MKNYDPNICKCGNDIEECICKELERQKKEDDQYRDSIMNPKPDIIDIASDIMNIKEILKNKPKFNNDKK
jgi:hypothetical protein